MTQDTVTGGWYQDPDQDQDQYIGKTLVMVNVSTTVFVSIVLIGKSNNKLFVHQDQFYNLNLYIVSAQNGIASFLTENVLF